MSRQQTQVLKVRLEPENFNAGRTAFQNLATDTKSAGGAISTLNTNLQTVTKSTDAIGSNIKKNVVTPLQEVDKTTTSVGAKLANFGKKFAGSIANVGALGGQVFNLTRQYQDLTDTQIRVDRTQLKMSKTTEAETKARDKLNKLVASGITSGADYEAALIDVNQAQEAAALAVTMHGEALEDQQRAYENFALNLAPTVVQAGGTIITMFKDLGGTKGFGGIATKIKGLVTGGGGLGSLTGALSNMSGSFSGAEASAGKFSKATEFLKANISSLIGVIGGLAGAAIILEIGAKAQAILDKMSTSNVGKRGGLIQAAFGDAEQIKIQSMAIAEYDAIVKNTNIAGINLLYDAIFGTSTVETAAKSAGLLDKQGKILKEAAVAAIDLGKDFKMTASQYADSALTMLESGKSVAEVSDYLTKESFIPQEKALVILDLALTKFNATLKETGKAYATLDQALGRKAITDTFFPPNTQQAILQAASKSLGTSGKTIIGFMEDEVEKVRKAEIQQKIFQAVFGDAKTATGKGGAFAEFQATGEKAIADYIAGLKTALEKGAATTKEGEAFAAYGEKVTAAFQRVEDQMIKNANAATLFDASFKPLPQTVQQLVGPLAQAEANLKASKSGLSNMQIGIDNAVAKFNTFKTSLEINNAEMEKYRQLLINAIPGFNQFSKTSELTTAQLEDLFAAAQKGPAEFNALLKSLKETNTALWETGKAADVMYGKLIPANKKLGIPEGGRSGKMRIRSDYQRPLIGSPEAQRSMILGQRPKVFARGSAELAKLASKINIGDNMVKQGDKYAQGVGKMVTANKTLSTSLGNMPASLIPVNRAVTEIPKNVQPATAAANEMNKALSNIPKAVTPVVTTTVVGQKDTDTMSKTLTNMPKVTLPKVTTTVAGQAATNAMNTALKNMPKQTTPKVTAKVGGQPQVNQLALSINNLKSKTVTVTTVFRTVGNQAVARGRATGGQGVGAVFRPTQHGYSGTVKRPTIFLAGEGHRQEDIDITPRGSAQRHGSGLGGGDGNIYLNAQFFLDGQPITGKIRYTINQNQAIFK